MRRLLLAAGFLAAAASPALAEVSLPSIFGDGMVLQRGRPVPVWGWADAGEEVTVTVAGRTATAKAGADGRWRVDLPALEASGPQTLVVQGSNRITLGDVLVGEVWIASGQSNMSMVVLSAMNAPKETAAAEDPELRLFTVGWDAAVEPAPDCKGRWTPCTSKTAAVFSAVGYFFARELRRSLKVPVGIIATAVGGTPAEAWTRRESLAKDPEFKPLLDHWEQALGGYDPVQAAEAYRKALEAWEKAASAARNQGRKPPPKPWEPPDPRRNSDRPGALFDGMVHPLVPLAVRGVVWYQGESNAARAAQYRALFPALVADWRAAFGRPDLPFHFVQIAGFGKPAPSGGSSTWAELREAQFLALRSVKDAGMAVTIDIGDAANIHPKNKQEVGRRLALWALAKQYGADVVFSGPLWREAKVEAAAVRLRFDFAAGLKAAEGGPLAGFAIAGADGNFVPARAKIDGEEIVVSGAPVPRPAFVRYAWADAPEKANLVNAAGLPASPFRTDDLPGITQDLKW